MERLDNKIEQYILGELGEKDRIVFEETLKTDPELAQSVAAHRALMERLEALRLRKKVENVLKEADFGLKGRRKKFLGRIFWGFAMALALVVGAYWFFQQKPAITIPKTMEPQVQPSEDKKPSDSAGPEKMAQQELPPVPPDIPKRPKTAETPKRLLALAHAYQEAPETSIIRDSREALPDSAKTITQRAAEQYAKGNFAAVVQMLLSQDRVAQDETALFLRASARFKLGQNQKAASDFEALNDSFEFNYKARWNYMLCQLALGEMDKVHTLLKEMEVDMDSPFRGKALELKSKL